MNKVHQKKISQTAGSMEIYSAYTRAHEGTKGKFSYERDRIINERGKEVVEITEAQSGGIPDKATVGHLWNKGNNTCFVFLDVQKAYDKTWLDAILYALHKNGVKWKNTKW